ncbi:hypothetical protein C8R43DRAFT_956040 [Mycena crocata]|nr:hypothetical protein C8R43DRAFT_956040 [Mycena crocata]
MYCGSVLQATHQTQTSGFATLQYGLFSLINVRCEIGVRTTCASAVEEIEEAAALSQRNDCPKGGVRLPRDRCFIHFNLLKFTPRGYNMDMGMSKSVAITRITPEHSLKSVVLLVSIISSLMGYSDGHYIRTLTVPRLPSLHISGDFLTPDPIATLRSFIAKSGCNLQRLCIARYCAPQKSAYRNVFPDIPTLSFNKRRTHWERSDDPRADELREEDSDSD